MRWLIATLLVTVSSSSPGGEVELPLEGEVSAHVIHRIAFGSCIRQQRPVPILDTLLGDDPDVCVFLGDNIYADTEDMERMQAEYARLGAAPEFSRLRRACPLLATWDDHDYGVNDGGAEFPEREASQRVFLDFWNVPADSPRRRRAGVYGAWLFGPPERRVQIVLLDTRYFRSMLKRGPRRVGGSWVPDDDPKKTVLGEEQWRWLEDQLRVPARVRVIGTSIQCLAADAGQETWSNLPRERERFLRLLGATRAAGVVLISGDRHWAELSSTDQIVPYRLYELTSSSFNQIHPRGTPTENRFRDLPATYHRENYGLITLDWEQADPTLRLQIRDLNGEVVISKSVPLSTLQP